MTLGLKLAIALWILGAVLVGLVLRYGLRLTGRIAAARTWPSAEATITRSEVRPIGKGSFGPGIVYRYSVGGRAFDGFRLHFGARSGNHAFAKQIVDAHPVGMETRAFYDPENPGFAVLKAEGDPKAYVRGAGLLALMFVFVGVVLMFVD